MVLKPNYLTVRCLQMEIVFYIYKTNFENQKKTHKNHKILESKSEFKDFIVISKDN